MKLRCVELSGLPGLERTLLLGDLPAIGAVVLGPNGSGKSSLSRGIADLIWERREAPGVGHAAWLAHGGALQSSYGPGQRLRFEPTAPTLPPARFARLYFLDLEVFHSGAGRKDLEVELRRELRSGYDLAAVGAAVREPWRTARPLRAARRVLDDARRQLAAQRTTQRALDSERARLIGLETDRRAAEAAREDLRAHERALAALKAADARDAAARVLAELPAAARRYSPEDPEQLATLERTIADAQTARTTASAQRDTHEQTLAQLRDVDGLAATVERIDLPNLARALEQENARVEAVEEKLDQLFAGQGPALLEPEQIAHLDVLLDTAERAQVAHHAACERLELFDAQRDGAQPALDPRALRDGENALSRWLEADVGVQQRPRTGLGAAVVLAAVALLGAAVLFAANAPLAGALAFLCVLALLPLAFLLLRRSPDNTAVRSREADIFARTQLEPPAEWTTRAVADRLVEVRAEIKNAELQVARDSERTRAAQAIARLDAAAGAARAERDRFLLELGLRAPSGPVAAMELTRQLRAVLELRAELEQATRRADGAQRALGQARLAVERWLAEVGIALPAGALDAQRVFERVEQRRREREGAAQQCAQARAELARCERQLETDAAALQRLCTRLGIEPEGAREAVAALAQQAQVYQAHDLEHRAREQELARSGVLAQAIEAWRTRGVDAIAAAIAEAQERVEGRDGIVDAIKGIEVRIAQAERDDAFERALADERARTEDLEQATQQGLRAAALEFLLEDVEHEHDAVPRSQLLARAGVLFARFTRGDMALLPARSTPGDARDRGYRIATSRGAEREPAQLSSATFAQLELALRIAVIERVEEGTESLPLFLDEVLTHSDPARFAAMADALAELAHNGRQIFFATSDPVDAQRYVRAFGDSGAWPAIVTLDGSRPEPVPLELLQLDALPAIPAPDSLAPQEYAARLGVPRLNPFASVDNVHPYYLYRDALACVHALARGRFEHVGACRRFFATGGAVEGVTREEFELRCSALEATLAAFRIGRAAPFPPELIEQAIPKSQFLHDVVAYASMVGFDGRALLDGLERKAGPELRRPQREALEQHLLDGGHLKDEPALPPHAVAARALENLALVDGAARERAAAWIHGFVGALFKRSEEDGTTRTA